LNKIQKRVGKPKQTKRVKRLFGKNEKDGCAQAKHDKKDYPTVDYIEAAVYGNRDPCYYGKHGKQRGLFYGGKACFFEIKNYRDKIFITESKENGEDRYRPYVMTQDASQRPLSHDLE
jgi:hypothetical protein